MKDFNIKSGDTLPYLRCKIVSKETGEVHALSNTATATFTMVDENGDVVIDDAPVVVEDDVGAIIHYEWDEADTANRGGTVCDGEFRVEDDGETFKVPGKGYIKIVIGESLT